MAYIASGDISITLSGGLNNSQPDLSLGGDPSSQPIIGERLFTDITADQSTSGYEDFRCVYINNNSFEASLYSGKIYAEYKDSSDVTVQLGFIESDERQTITVSNYNKIIGGGFELSYTDYESTKNFTVEWNTNESVWASNLQAALRSIKNLEDIVVSELISDTRIDFEINFIGKAGKRYHELIQKVANNLNCSSGTTEISVSRSILGSPINNAAEEIDFATTTPYAVEFSTYSSLSGSYAIGDIRPGDIIPVWIKRTTPAGAHAIESDGIILRIEGRATSGG